MSEGRVAGGYAPGGVAEVLKQDGGERRCYALEIVQRDVHNAVADLADEVGLQVVLPPRRRHRQLLGFGVRHGPDVVQDWLSQLPERPDDTLSIRYIAVVAEQNAARLPRRPEACAGT